MLGKNHLLIGIAASATLLLMSGVSPVDHSTLFGGGLLAGAVGALLPDIDSPEARIRTTVGLGSRQARRNLRRRNQDSLEKGLNMVRFVLARLLDIATELLPHRGVTHWGLTWLLVVLGGQIVSAETGWPALYSWSFAVGYGTHLLADSITRAGIPFYYPLLRRRVRLLPRRWAVRTGGAGERLAVAALLALMLGTLVLGPKWQPLLVDGPIGLLLADLLL